MPWPETRLRTYAANDPVLAADLNFLQDAIISGQHGDVVLTLMPTIGHIVGGWASGGAPNGAYMLASAGGSFVVPIPLKEGDRIKSVTFARYGDGAADFTTGTKVHKVTAAGVVSDIGLSGGVANPPAAWADTTIDVNPDVTLAAGEAVFIIFDGNAANLRVGPIRVTYDHP